MTLFAETTIDLLPPVSPLLVAWLAAAALSAVVLMRVLTGPPVPAARRWGLLAVRGLVLLLLLALVANPVRIDESPGTVEPAEVFYLLDASQSMAIGASPTRWQDAIRAIRDANDRLGRRATRTNVSMFRFGSRFAAIEGTSQRQLISRGGASSNGAAASGLAPADPDTRLAPALRQLSSRFGQSPPAGVVVFSDGRVHDSEAAEQVAAQYKRLDVPIHVVPLGNRAKGGDIAVAGVVAPARVRKYSTVEVQIFLRSFGHEGRRTEVELVAVGGGQSARRRLASLPVTLRDGVQSVTLSFQSDLRAGQVQVSVPLEEGEVSTANNSFSFETAIDRTKIRVLYVEGSREPTRVVMREGRREARGPHSDLHDALVADPDIECAALLTGGSSRLRPAMVTAPGFPDTVAELAAFDVIVLSNVSRESFTDEQLDWIVHWIDTRGGGLLMAGGPDGFASGGWHEGKIAQLLPAELGVDANDWHSDIRVAPHPISPESPHPIWHIVDDKRRNLQILQSIPPFTGANLGLRPKTPLADVLATATVGDSASEPLPMLIAGQHGRGRIIALAAPLAPPWATDFNTNWAQGKEHYAARFWRNAMYWLSENSSIGRRRMAADVDKRFYRPGETIALSAAAWDEAARSTTAYRIVAMIEPQSAFTDLDSLDSPVLWPNGTPRSSGGDSPYIAWGEEFELLRRAETGGYELRLDVAEAAPASADTRSLRIELTAYEGLTQVDSTSLDVQVVHDPFEQQNPFPDHGLLERLAAASGGKVLPNSAALASMIENMPVKVGPSELRKAPLWSKWWLLTVLLGLMTVDWAWRRNLGLG